MPNPERQTPAEVIAWVALRRYVESAKRQHEALESAAEAPELRRFHCAYGSAYRDVLNEMARLSKRVGHR